MQSPTLLLPPYLPNIAQRLPPSLYATRFPFSHQLHSINDSTLPDFSPYVQGLKTGTLCFEVCDYQ